MTTNENLPATRTAELATSTTDTDSWVDVVRPISILAQQIADTEFVPKGLRGSAAATAAAILYGREVGLPPMTALNMTHVVEGRPGVSAEAMRAMVYAAGHELEFVATTGAVCDMRARRRGAEGWTNLRWTIDMAREAGLTGKNNWKSYPRAMLQARCTTELCRMVFPDVIHGFRSLEELEDMGSEPGDTGPAQIGTAGGTTRVSRKRTAKAPAPDPAPVLEGPPLPGEPGYEETSVAASGETPPDPTGEVSATVEDAATEPPTNDSEPSGDTPGDDPAPETTGPKPVADKRPMSRPQQRMLMAMFGNLGITDDKLDGRVERLHITSVIVGRQVESTSELNHHEASLVIDTLGRCGEDYNRLAVILEAIEKERNENP